ncbi:DUF3667 domain-containing protein [Alkalicaulis satelles]|nr:DUF3667 domain-containing protein [Alkalicaulis satelles]
MSEPDLEAAARTAAEHAVAIAAAGAGRKPQTRPSRPSALRPDTPDGVCANCGAQLMGPVCHACGQHADLYKRPVWRLIGDGISDMFALDGRVARTLWELMAFPGRVTRAYLKGQRGRYIPPFRLYLIASLAFFLILPLITAQNALINFQPEGADQARLALTEALESGEMSQADFDRSMRAIDTVMAFETQTPAAAGEESEGEASEGESILTGPQISDGQITAMRRVFVPEEFGEAPDGVTGSRAARSYIADRIERLARAPDRWAAESFAWAPRIMFVMVPLFGVLLGLVYVWRRGFLYFDHLITALQFHAAIFIAMLAAILISLVTGPGWAVLAFFIYAHIYLYRLLRVVYSTGRIQAILRVAALDAAYGFLILMGLTVVVLLGAVSA